MIHERSGRSVQNCSRNMLKLEEGSLNLSLNNFQDYDDEFSEIENESTTTEQSLPKESLPWDAFTYSQVKKESASMQSNEWLNISISVIKVLVYGVLFCIVLCSGLITKFMVLLAISQLQENKDVQYCDYFSEHDEELGIRITKKGRVTWTWYIIFMFLVPECLTMLDAIWSFLFKKKAKLPEKRSIIILFTLEAVHPIGVALLVFYSLPRLSSVDAAAISSCVCFIPALLNLISQQKTHTSTTGIFMLVILCNILAVVAQCSGIFIQSFLSSNIQDPLAWILPIGLILTSCRWWSNYVSHFNYYGSLRFLANIKKDLLKNCYVLEGYVALWRSFIFILSALIISLLKEIQVQQFFDFSWENEYDIELIEVSNSFSEEDTLQSKLYFRYGTVDTIRDSSAPLHIFFIQAFCAFLLYEAAKFAYQTQMHKFGFAFPIILITPLTITLILILDVLREQDTCIFHDVMPDYLFLNTSDHSNMIEFLFTWRIWFWIIWWISQIWITSHIWLGENERLSPAKKIFYHPGYESFMPDQFMELNKRRHENDHVVDEEKEEHPNPTTKFEPYSLNETQTWNTPTSSIFKRDANNKRNCCVTQIYACATMWHETEKEMSELIGSILRLDKDQCAMRVTQKYYKIHIKDYYELETHIVFDDAFCCMHGCIGPCDHDENETQVNQYVTTFIEAMRENIRNLGIRDLPPIKCPTPYGGQLIWTLPGKTRLTVHLKDKNKIRHRKRWSQVMYMYYLLGYLLMGSSLDVDTKEIMAENTYILTLDGDVDFRPTAVKALIDLMKKNKELGAACGRIHPIGRGPMLWLQKFEYAVGHWLQKSTEHTIGSVLCSPGCFSLFRAKALMKDNVLAKYATKSTEPRHYIQYDQGEDRWLCTLILQAGCKVEYCAAGDAYTHAPESFKEFYVQRRRWIPSTMANIFDLLGTSKETRKINDNISWLYVSYQWILTGSTIIGPAFIYLMMVGAFVTSFQMDNWLSFFYNAIPVLIFIITCLFCNVHMQLVIAEALTVFYALVMLVALVGIILQIAADGFLAPNAILFFVVIGQFVIAAFLHPQELSCLPHAFIYYITVPSMYMLLIIFSIFNLHNITWGTRESKTQTSENKSTSEQHSEHIAHKCEVFPLSKLFTCSFCACRNSLTQERYLESIYNSINEINIRLKEIESSCNINNTLKETMEEPGNTPSKTCSEQIKLQSADNLASSLDSDVEVSEHSSDSGHQIHSNYLINPFWLQNRCLQNGKVDFLPISEEEFWKQLIEKYLHPIENDMEKQQKIAKGLINIRNEYLLKFFLINTLFVVAIFLLQINKNALHVQWPFAIQYNITYPDDFEVHISRTYMHLEPIGCLFIVAFMFILFIQFLAMLVHRFNTFTHILANVNLTIPSFGKEKYLSEDTVTSTHAKNIAEGLQNATENNITFNAQKNVISSSLKQKTISELIEDQNSSKTQPNFEVLFHKKLRNPTASGLSKSMSSTLPKGIMQAFEKRRSNIIAKHKIQSQDIICNNTECGNPSRQHVYDNPTFVDDE